MLSILLIILKILGIIILSVVGLALLIVCLVLFAPICYNIQGRFQDSKFTMNGKAYWFIPGFSFRFSYEEGFCYSLKWFWHSFFSSENKDKPQKSKSNKKKQVSEELLSNEVRNENEVASVFDCQSKEQANQVDLSRQDSSASKEDLLQIKDCDPVEKSLEKKDCETEKEFLQNDHSESIDSKKNIFQKISIFIKDKLETIQAFGTKLKNMISNIFTKADWLKETISYYYNLWQKDATQKVIQDCKDRLIKLFKHLKPKKFDVDVYIGFEDPSKTGMITGIWGMLYPIWGGSLHLYPNFEKEIAEGKFVLKGNIRIVYILIAALQFYKDKRLKKLLVLLKKGGNHNGSK